jgi:hypothetical protein
MSAKTSRQACEGTRKPLSLNTDTPGASHEGDLVSSSVSSDSSVRILFDEMSMFALPTHAYSVCMCVRMYAHKTCAHSNLYTYRHGAHIYTHMYKRISTNVGIHVYTQVSYMSTHVYMHMFMYTSTLSCIHSVEPQHT